MDPDDLNDKTQYWYPGIGQFSENGYIAHSNTNSNINYLSKISKIIEKEAFVIDPAPEPLTIEQMRKLYEEYKRMPIVVPHAQYSAGSHTHTINSGNQFMAIDQTMERLLKDVPPISDEALRELMVDPQACCYYCGKDCGTVEAREAHEDECE